MNRDAAKLICVILAATVLCCLGHFYAEFGFVPFALPGAWE